jgi:LmbE family N-acetylglucosaminyl deacetylase
MNVIAVEAHPDDVEFICAGTLARLAEKGHSISILSVTGGEGGSKTLTPDEVRKMRRKEAEASADILNGKFYLAQGRDKHFIFNEEVRNQVCEIFRMVVPDIVFALSPKDYILDHDFASLLARDCASAACATNFETGAIQALPPVAKIPYLYYCEPMFQMDIYGQPVPSSTYVDITSTMDTKRQMLACHHSQREFMSKHFAEDSIDAIIERWGRNNGKVIGCEYAEGFRQHLAPPFPDRNILVELIAAHPVPAGKVKP